ncbi:YjeJ family protein [Klebsiella sp. R390]|uniref:YjeJ family protein n=1 Tax=Klebsiella sp. R390 TaxID=2755400 RepID=UPI003DAA1C50
MNTLTGINSGIIKSPQGVVAIALKASCASGAEHLLYLPPNQMRELMFAISACHRALLENYQTEPEVVKAQVTAATNILSANPPVITLEEVQNPQVELRVTNFIFKQNKGKPTFLFFLQNEGVVSIELSLAQIEFIITLFLISIRKSDDEGFITLMTGANDFIPLYTTAVSTTQGGGLTYHRFNIPEWKIGVLACFYSLIFIQQDGHVPCGIIFKAGDTLEPSRAENIGTLFLSGNTLLAPYKTQSMHVDCVKLDVNEDNMESLLRAHFNHRATKLN